MKRKPGETKLDVQEFLRRIAHSDIFAQLTVSNVMSTSSSGECDEDYDGEDTDTDSEDEGDNAHEEECPDLVYDEISTPTQRAATGGSDPSPPSRKYFGVESMQEGALFSAHELYRRRRACDPIVDECVRQLVKVHHIADPMKELSLQIGQSKDMRGGGRQQGTLAGLGAEFLNATPQRERFKRRTEEGVWKKLGLRVDCMTEGLPGSTRTVIEMEQRGISHSNLEGMKALALLWWLPSRALISKRQQATIKEAKEAFRIRKLHQ
eukprot:1310829-Rhodomonas_salina.1